LSASAAEIASPHSIDRQCAGAGKNFFSLRDHMSLAVEFPRKKVPSLSMYFVAGSPDYMGCDAWHAGLAVLFASRTLGVRHRKARPG
jgi:hypothetical protein